MNRIEQRFIADLKKTVWPALNVTVKREYTGRLHQRQKGDYEIVIDGERKNIDVKAEENVPENFPIEIMQDWQTFDVGWYYTLSACDEVWYGQYRENTLTVYRISLKRLRQATETVSEKWQSRKTAKGQGDTVFIAAPINELLSAGIAKKIYQHPAEMVTSEIGASHKAPEQSAVLDELNRIANEGWENA